MEERSTGSTEEAEMDTEAADRSFRAKEDDPGRLDAKPNAVALIKRTSTFGVGDWESDRGTGAAATTAESKGSAQGVAGIAATGVRNAIWPETQSINGL